MTTIEAFEKTNGLAVAPAIPQTPNNPFALIALGIERGIDPEKMKGLYDLYERHERNQAAERFGVALAAFQGACPTVLKHRKTKESAGSSFGYNFASFDDVMAQAKPFLVANEISVSFDTNHNLEKGILTVTARIRVGTHFEDKTFSCPVASSLKISDAQKYGSALSYAKRYCLCAALNIVTTDQDDDGKGTYEYISEDQVAEINTLLEKCNGSPDLRGLLHWLNVPNLGELPASEFSKAITHLKSKVLDPVAANAVKDWTEFFATGPKIDALNKKLHKDFMGLPQDKAIRNPVWKIIVANTQPHGLMFDPKTDKFVAK